jgi:hypothetical protein
LSAFTRIFLEKRATMTSRRNFINVSTRTAALLGLGLTLAGSLLTAQAQPAARDAAQRVL